MNRVAAQVAAVADYLVDDSLAEKWYDGLAVARPEKQSLATLMAAMLLQFPDTKKVEKPQPQLESELSLMTVMLDELANLNFDLRLLSGHAGFCALCQTK